MKQGHEISHATVRPGDLLYTPAGAIVAEKYIGENLGVRMTVLAPTSRDPVAIDHLRAVRNEHRSAGRRNAPLDGAIDVLAALSDAERKLAAESAARKSRPESAGDPDAGNSASATPATKTPVPATSTPRTPQTSAVATRSPPDIDAAEQSQGGGADTVDDVEPPEAEAAEDEREQSPT